MVSLTSIKNDVAAAAAKAASSVKNGVVGAGKLLGNQSTQDRVNEAISISAENFRAGVAGYANDAIRFLNEDGVKVLQAPVKSMSEFSAKRLVVNKEDYVVAKGYKNTRNVYAATHEGIIRGGEMISRVAGDRINALVRLPFIPVTALLKFVGLTQIAKGIELVGNAFALAVGFIARGIILALSQLAHFALLAVEAVNVAVVVALAIAIGFIAHQTGFISGYLFKENNDIKKELKAMQENSLVNRVKDLAGFVANGASAVAAKAYKNKGKIALAALAAAGYNFGAYGAVSKAVANYFAPAAAPAILSDIFGNYSTCPAPAAASEIANNFEAAKGVVLIPAALAGLKQIASGSSTGIASQDAAKLLINGSRVAISA